MKTTSDESVPLAKVIKPLRKAVRNNPRQKAKCNENSTKPPKVVSRADKRSASDMDPLDGSKVARKRTAFGDITNALQTHSQQVTAQKKCTQQITKIAQDGGKSAKLTCIIPKPSNKITAKHNSKVSVQKAALPKIVKKPEQEVADLPRHVIESESVSSSSEFSNPASSRVSLENSPSDNLDWIFDSESNTDHKDDTVPLAPVKTNASSTAKQEELSSNSDQGRQIRIVDQDPDPNVVSEYAESIFHNMRSREVLFPVTNYLDGSACTASMRAILVDWLVEVQENFELYHETLYLGVKLVDLYLQHAPDTSKEDLQLVGAGAMMIACKIEERHPPPVDDFRYICDDAYKNSDFIKMEMSIFRALDFNAHVPVSYRFLRRFARVAGANMEALTLARFILETSLMEHKLIDARPSHVASACLALALRMKDSETLWDATLEYHTGYTEKELLDTMCILNQTIKPEGSASKLSTVRNKYSHPIFYEVAKTKPLDAVVL